MHSRKSQFAVEHMIVIAIGLMIILPVINMFYSYSSGQSDDMRGTQIQQIGNSIVDSSSTIFYMGPPAKITLEQNFPDKISDIEILGGRELVFYTNDNHSSIPFLSDVPIDGPYYMETTASKRCHLVEGRPCFSKGLKRVTVAAINNKSAIIIK